MVALTESAPTPGKARSQRRREERNARKLAARDGSGGTGLRPVPSSTSTSSNGTGVPSVATSRSTAPLDALLTDYLNDSFALPDLAARHKLSLPELCDMLESPQFTELLDRLRRLAEKRAQDVATHTRAGALSTLETVCATAINPETARKAASTLIRASDRVIYPRATRGTAPKQNHSASTAPEGLREVATGEASPCSGASETRGNDTQDPISPRKGEGTPVDEQVTGQSPAPPEKSEMRFAAVA